MSITTTSPHLGPINTSAVQHIISNGNYNIWGGAGIYPSTTLNNPSVAGELTVSGDVILRGESLHSRLERIEALLHIPTRDVTLEEKYPDLKRLWKEYNDALDNYRTWEILNND